MAGPGRQPETSDNEILKAIALHPDPIVTASEIASRVDMTNAGVNQRMPDLVADGLVVRKEVGAHAVVYWLTDKGKQQLGGY